MGAIVFMLPAQRLGPPGPAGYLEPGADVPRSFGKVVDQIAGLIGVSETLNDLGSRDQAGARSLAAIPDRDRAIGRTPTGLAPSQFACKVSPASLLAGQMIRVQAATQTNVAASFKGRAPRPHRAREWAWRAANSEGLRREFPGEWIVLEGEEIVGHGADPVELVNAARRRGIRVPYIFRVEDEARPRTSFLGI